MGTSGKFAFANKTLLITQISVHKPKNVMELMEGTSFNNSINAVDPKVGFSTPTASFSKRASCTVASNFQPGVPLTQ